MSNLDNFARVQENSDKLYKITIASHETSVNFYQEDRK